MARGELGVCDHVCMCMCAKIILIPTAVEVPADLSCHPLRHSSTKAVIGVTIRWPSLRFLEPFAAVSSFRQNMSRDEDLNRF